MKEAVRDPLHNQPQTFLSNGMKRLQSVGLNVSRRKEHILKINILLISAANIKIVDKVKHGKFLKCRCVNLRARYGIHSLQLHPYNSMFFIGVEVRLSTLASRVSAQPTLPCLEPPLFNNECRYFFHK
jgi:hypothetical protein